MARRQVRLQDVAKRAGTSVATVSRLLNKKPLAVHVSDETRGRVLKAAEEIGYRPNRLARGLVTSRTRIIGLSLPVYGPPTNSLHRWSVQGVDVGSMISGVLAACYPENYDVIILQRQEFVEPEPTPTVPLCADFTDGLIYAAPNVDYDHYSQFLDTSLPLVMVGKEQSDRNIRPYVTLNNENEFLRLTRALIRKGHRRIALLLPEKRSHSTSQWTLAGYSAAFKESGIPMDESLVVEDGDPGQMVREVMQRGVRPTVIIVARNNVAVPVLETVKQLGRRCPEDVEIVVFGDDHEFEQTRPRLSALRGDISGLGFEAARMMFQLLRGETPVSSELNRPCDFIRRESSGLQSL